MNQIIISLLKNNIIKKDEIDIYQYSLFVISFNFLCVVTAIVIGTIFGMLKFSLLFFLIYTPVRIFLGGYHCKRPITCICLFEVMFSAIILLNKLVDISEWRIFICGLIILASIHRFLFDITKENIKSFILLLTVLSIVLCLVFYMNIYRKEICSALLMNGVFYYLQWFIDLKK